MWVARVQRTSAIEALFERLPGDDAAIESTHNRNTS
jgi:hypothetical protein